MIDHIDKKKHTTIDYEGIMKLLSLQSESSLHSFGIDAESSLIPTILDRSVLISDAVTLWLCRSGSLVVSIEGTSHTLSAGQLLIIFAGTHFRLTLLSADYTASVTVARISHSAQVDSIVTTFPRVRQMPIVQLFEQENKTLTALMNYISISSQNYRNPSRAEIDNNILSILRGELIDIFLRRNLAVREATPDEQLVKRFNMMLAVSCFEHRDVEYYAESFGLTPKRFAAKVKRITGTTPSDLIASAVIKNAKRLLVSTPLSSAEVAEKLNFSTPSFFCRYFRRYTNETPQGWRNKNTNF